MTAIKVKVLLIPGQFSDTPKNHAADVAAALDFGVKHGVDLYGGTEANPADGNNTPAVLHDLAPGKGIAVRTTPRGDCWVGVDHRFGHFASAGFLEVVRGVAGPPSKGGHGPRGLMRGEVVPRDRKIADRIALASVHLVTGGTDPNTARGRQNALLAEEAGKWATREGKGAGSLAIAMGDMNTDDKHRDVWRGAPLVTSWDDLHEYPTTHPHPDGSGPTLDVIARYAGDGRVTFASSRALTDAELPLHFDHYPVLAVLNVEPRKGIK